VSRGTRTPGAIVTVPPHADFLEAVARHPAVVGLRLNTVMPIKGSEEEVLARLASLGQPLWIDLKGRQLRVRDAAVPPFTEVRLSHSIRVETPTVALFGNGKEAARVLEVDGDRLILEDGPRRVLGPGESVNVPCSTLEIEGDLTERDRRYVEAAASLGLHDYMLSFVERPEDVAGVKAIDPEARVVCKIESLKGLDYAREHGASHGPLMAARGDLYLELRQPHHLLRALRDVVTADPDAIVASRILDSLAWEETPSAQDLTDVAYLRTLGYRRLMLGDEVCLRRDTVLPALDLLDCLLRERLAAPTPRTAVSSAA
jgi:pyruvate kinase